MTPQHRDALARLLEQGRLAGLDVDGELDPTEGPDGFIPWVALGDVIVEGRAEGLVARRARGTTELPVTQLEIEKLLEV